MEIPEGPAIVEAEACAGSPLLTKLFSPQTPLATGEAVEGPSGAENFKMRVLFESATYRLP